MLFPGTSAPTFDDLPSTESIHCDFTSGNTITTVQVTDSDSTGLTFSIDSVSPTSSLFSIHPTTGKVNLKHSLLIFHGICESDIICF